MTTWNVLNNDENVDPVELGRVEEAYVRVHGPLTRTTSATAWEAYWQGVADLYLAFHPEYREETTR